MICNWYDGTHSQHRMLYLIYMPASKDDAVAKPLLKLVESFEKLSKSKGPVEEWTDKFLLSTRDRFRKAARKHRGGWNIDFYEALQTINKESLKRGQKPQTA